MEKCIHTPQLIRITNNMSVLRLMEMKFLLLSPAPNKYKGEKIYLKERCDYIFEGRNDNYRSDIFVLQ